MENTEDLSKSKDKTLQPFSYEDAVEKTQVGKFHYFLLFIAGMCFTSFITEITGLGLIVYSAKCDLQFSLAEQGLIGSAGFLGVALSSHAMGFLADTWGRLKTLRTTIFLSLVTSLISAFSVDVWMLFTFRLLTGMFISGCQACVFSFVGEFHSSKSRSKHVAMISALSALGFIILPVLCIFILPLTINFTMFGIKMLPWRILMITNTFPSIIGLIGIFLLPESPKYLLSQGKHSESIEILRKVYSINTGNIKTSYPCEIITIKDTGSSLANVKGCGEAMELIRQQTLGPFSKERILQTINMCFMTFVLNLIAQGTFMYFPKIIGSVIANSEPLTICEAVMLVGQQNSNQTSEEICASTNSDQYIFVSAIGVVFMFFYFFISNIINIVGKKRLLIIWMTIGGTFAGALYWISNFYLILLALLMIAALGNCIGIMITIAIEFYPININAMGVTLVMMVGRLGAVTGTNVIGPLLLNNCNTMFFSYAGVIGFLILLGFLLPK